MGELVPLWLRPSDDDGDGHGDQPTTPVTFAVDGRHYEVDLTEAEAAKLARDLERVTQVVDCG